MYSTDEKALLDAVPGYLSFGTAMKAVPSTEGDSRFVYLEASNESIDQQNEIVLQKALKESVDYFRRFGNLDIDHYTQIGAKVGIPNHESYEIGHPVEVRFDESSTFVKGQIFSGSGPAAEKANQFWSSITELNPPKRWYPSVGGSVLDKALYVDPDTHSKRAVIRKVRWTNIGFSKTPVNGNLQTIKAVPFGALAKSLCVEGLDFTKALEAGYGTDSATLTGGAALRKESLESQLISYWDFRENLAALIRQKKVSGGQLPELVKAAQGVFGLSVEMAKDYVKRFLKDIETNVRSI
jgi:hypothetical protein